MRLLLLTPQLPYPPRQGAAMRNYNIARLLSSEAEVSLLSFPSDYECPEALPRLRESCARVEVAPRPHRRRSDRLATLLFRATPDLATRLASVEFARMLSELLSTDSFDLVQVEGLELAGYVLPVLQRQVRRRVAPGGWTAVSGPLFVLDEHNAEYLLQRRAFETTSSSPLPALYSLVQWRKLRLYERNACRLFDGVATVAESDRVALLGLDPLLNVRVIPNGVDVEYFHRDWRQGALTLAPPDLPPGPLVVFTGSMDFRPNVDAVTWFAQKVWPIVRQSAPEAEFYVVGRNPVPAVRKLARLSGITVTGGVPDVRPYLERAKAFVVPMRMGGGVRLKVLEAMSMSRPVVSTSMGLSGIDFEPGKHALLADDPGDFASAVCRLLEDSDLGARMGTEAAGFVRARYDWRMIVPEFLRLYEDLGVRRQGSGS